MIFLLDSESLVENVMERYDVPHSVANHLVRTYGGRVWDVCRPLEDGNRKTATLLHPDYPYLELEVHYACREYACTVEDVLSRRTRLAFLHKEVALQCIPRVAEIMQKELHWTKDVTKQQISAARAYIGSYGGGGGWQESVKTMSTMSHVTKVN
jgi:glycerol-3-phosphate dehydrogenase